MLKESAALKYQDEEISAPAELLPSIVNLPMDYEELMQNKMSTESIIETMRKGTSHTASLFIKIKSRCYNKVKMENIYYIEAMADYMLIHTHEKVYVVHSTMKNILKNLPKTEFARVHNSYIVRIDLISKIEDGTVLVKDKLLPIGETFKKMFFSNLNIII